MPEVDFYVLPSSDPDSRLAFACRLTEKVWRLGHRIYLHCADQAQLAAMDERLWRFKAEAFVPHGPVAEDPTGVIALGHGQQAPQHHRDVLINLDLVVPGFVEQFARVVELVAQQPHILQASRKNFRYYRDLGYPLRNHPQSHI